MERQNRLQSRETGSHHFRAAAEPSEEVRFDESGGDAKVSFDPGFVQPHGNAVTVLAQVHQRAIVAGIVVEDGHAVRDLVPHHCADLLVGVSAVGPGRDQDHHVLEPDNAVKLLENRRDHDVSWLGARSVADGDGDGRARPEQVA